MIARGATPIIAALCALSLAVLSASAGNPLDDVIAPGGKAACFKRDYDAAHLKAHPKQATVAMVFWIKAEAQPAAGRTIGISVTGRGDRDALFAQGGCSWDDRANRDTGSKRMVQALRKDAGAACIMLAEPEVFESLSAEEGGFLLFDVGKDRETLMVYLDDRLTMVKRADRRKQTEVRFGADDRVFLLRRVDLAQCAAVEDAVTEPEPVVQRR